MGNNNCTVNAQNTTEVSKKSTVSGRCIFIHIPIVILNCWNGVIILLKEDWIIVYSTTGRHIITLLSFKESDYMADAFKILWKNFCRYFTSISF